MRRVLLGLLVALAALLALNTVVMNRETKAAEADAGRIIELPGGDLQVREYGSPDAPNMVLLHGFACSLGWWDDAAPALARDHHVIAVDLLGHGGSEKPRDGYGRVAQSLRVSAALDELGVRRAVIVGHSMGGAVATALVELRRPLVESLVILDTGPDRNDGQLPFTARLSFVPVLGQAIRRTVPDAMVRNGLESAFAPGYDVPDRFVDDLRDMTYTSYDDSHTAVDDYREESGLADRLADEDVPLLVIFGSQDDIADPESAQDYRKVPRARIVLLDGVGHSPHVEKPGATARLIRSFVEGQAG